MQDRPGKFRTDTTELGDLIRLDGDYYFVTNLEPLELTAVEEYGETGCN